MIYDSRLRSSVLKGLTAIRSHTRIRRWKYQGVEYRDFWADFRPEEFYMHGLLVEHRTRNEISVSSVYPGLPLGLLQKKFRLLNKVRIENRLFPRRKKRIWWTGENVRPPSGGSFSLHVSFEQENQSHSSVYFPLFYSELLFPNTDSRNRLGIEVPLPEELLQGRSTSTKDHFVCGFINNPVPARLHAISVLSNYGKVDVFGSLTRKPVEGKYDVARHYRFVLCFENSLYPGYVTEKLLDAYLCDSIPLYFGDLGKEPHINRKAIINANDFESLDDFARYVGSLSTKEYDTIHGEPLLNSMPNPRKLISAIQNLD